LTDNKGCAVDINAVACIRFASGAMATITSGGDCSSWKSHLTIQCEKGRMEISPHGGNFLIARGGYKRDIRKTPKGFDVPSTTPIRNFADVILGKEKEPRCGGRVGILLADLMDALYESAKTGKVVKVAAGGW
jgi:predicted dehydrogenase